MRHEDFYLLGTCSDPEMGVYGGWVAHPGSFAAAVSRQGQGEESSLAFAGECFPDNADGPAATRERGDTGPHGHVLGSYERFGEDSLAELNGLFSGLILDRRRRRALLFIDRYAGERLYVHEGREATYFASEAKALLRVLPELRAFDDQGVGELLTFGCPLAGRTLFRGITKLEGGALWVFEGSSCRKTRYFVPAQWERQPVLAPDDFESEFQRVFRTVSRRYVGGGSRIGISLTGGLDTRMIMACLPDLPNRPVAYTFAGLEGVTLDARVASQVAAVCGLQHRLLRISPSFLADFPRHVDRTVYITDGSLGALGAHEIYLNAQARDLASVRLTGNFGSEVLRSMSTFKPLRLAGDFIPPHLRGQMEAAARRGLNEAASPVTFAAFREIPWSLFGTMAAARSQLTFRTPYLDNALVSLAYRGPIGMRKSPGPAMRLIRDIRPSLSAIATDRAVILNGHGIAYALRRVIAETTFKLDYLHKEALPRPLLTFDRAIGRLHRLGVLGLHKYLPYRTWFRNELSEYTASVLTDRTTTQLGYWTGARLAALAGDHKLGRGNYVREINAVLTLAAVDRLLLRQPVK